MASGALHRWNALVAELNGRPLVGTPGIRDVDHPCEEYDGKGYNGRGECMSDGHYECNRCSRLSPLAYRFTEYGAAGRLDRIRLLRLARRVTA